MKLYFTEARIQHIISGASKGPAANMSNELLRVRDIAFKKNYNEIKSFYSSTIDQYAAVFKCNKISTFKYGEQHLAKLVNEITAEINEFRSYNKQYTIKIVNVIYPDTTEYYTKYIGRMLSFVNTDLVNEYYDNTDSDMDFSELISSTKTPKWLPIFEIEIKKRPYDLSKPSVGNALLAGDKHIATITKQPVEPDTPYEQALYSALGDYYDTSSTKTSKQLIKYYTALQQLKDKFPTVLRPDAEYLYRGVNTHIFVRKNINALRAVIKSGNFDVIVYGDGNPATDSYVQMCIGLYVKIKPYRSVTSWTTKLDRAEEFGECIYISKPTDNFVMNPKVSNEIGGYGEYEVLYMSPEIKPSEMLIVFPYDIYEATDVLNVAKYIRPRLDSGDYIKATKRWSVVPTYLKIK